MHLTVVRKHRHRAGHWASASAVVKATSSNRTANITTTHTAHTRRSHCALGKTRLAGWHSLLDATGQIIATAATHAALSRTSNLHFYLNNVTHSVLSTLLPTNWKICFKKTVQFF
jgi:hypothetical protein